MSKVYLPTAEQMDDTIKNLGKIADVLGAKTDTSTWKGIQNVVRMGLAPKLFPIGSQLRVSHSKYGDIIFDVVAHDYFKSNHNENKHTMTLLTHDCITNALYDGIEAFYYAEAYLPAGTYNFTIDDTYVSWAAGTYQFTLTNELPAGGQLGILSFADKSLTELTVKSFADKYATDAIEECAITLGNSGTSLGTFGVELNHIQRVSTGSNNYKESAVRQFLNSNAAAGDVWTPQTKFDRPPSWKGTLPGFMKGLDADFLSVVGEVGVPCSANNTYESPDSTVSIGEKYTVRDKFYLASMVEIVGQYEYEDGAMQFPYFKNATDVDFIKYLSGVAKHWWTRTPVVQGARSAYLVHSEGSVTSGYAYTQNALVIACTIV